MKCKICRSPNNVSFRSDYKFEIDTDKKYFGDLKIYTCKSCDLSFADPLPKEDELNFFYENIYRSLNRPPYWLNEFSKDLETKYLDDRQLNYLLYITTLVDFEKINSIYDFGAGNGDLGFLLKHKFKNLELYCTEHDKHCSSILKKRGYTNFKDINDINKKFDLIVTIHTLEHLTDLKIFNTFHNLLNNNGLVFFEVPNCEERYFEGRPYDGPHLLFYTKKSIEKICNQYSFEILKFDYSSYSFQEDHKYQRHSQNLYKKISSGDIYENVKRKIRKFLPYKIYEIRQFFNLALSLKNQHRVNMFSNNVGNNCYIRGILKKKNT